MKNFSLDNKWQQHHVPYIWLDSDNISSFHLYPTLSSKLNSSTFTFYYLYNYKEIFKAHLTKLRKKHHRGKT